MFILLASIFALSPRLFLDPDTGGAGGGSSSPVEADFLSHLPGGDMLAGATPHGTPTPATADGEKGGEEEVEEDDDEDSEEEPGGETRPAAAVPPLALGELIKTLPEPAQAEFTTLTKERDAFKAEKETLAKEVENLRCATPAPQLASTAEHPLANVASEEGLTWHADLARDLKSWARRNLAAGGEMPRELYARARGRQPESVKDEELLFSADQAADTLDRAELMEGEVIPARRQYLTVEKESRSFVEQHYPDMLKPESEDGKVYTAFLKQFPQVRLLPRWPSALAAMVKGHRAMEADAQARAAKAKGKAAGEEPPVAPPIPGRGGPAPAGGAAKPSSPKPKKAVELSASMSPEDLARVM